jgi:hypothetical protein
MLIPIAKRWLVCLCAPLWLASCGLLQHKPVPVTTRTEIISVPTITYRPLPHELTAPLLAPLAPAAACVDAKGEPLVCALDGLLTIPDWEAILGTCNTDRARAALLGTTDGQ